MKEKDSFFDLLDTHYYKIAILPKKMKYSFLSYKRIKIFPVNLNKIISQSLDNETFSVELIETLIDSKIDEKHITCFFNFEILFRPEYRFNLLSYLKEKSKIKEFAIIWPGEIHKDYLVYSRSGRPDYYTHKIDNYLIYEEEK